MVGPLLPVAVTGRRARDLRRQVDGIRHRVRVGCPARRAGPVRAVAEPVSGVPPLSACGVWDRVLDALRTLADAGGQICWEVSVDSTIARAHQHAAGARQECAGQKEPPGPGPADHGLGHSRGGWTTKIQAACEQGQKLMGMVVTAGQWSDGPQFGPVLDRIRVARPGRVGRPRTRVRTGSVGTRRTPLRPTVGCCAGAVFGPRSRRSGTTAPTVWPGAVTEVARRGSTTRTTRPGTRWSACSTGSSATGRWPPGMTSSRSASRRP